jgi:hypothetical protein
LQAPHRRFATQPIRKRPLHQIHLRARDLPIGDEILDDATDREPASHRLARDLASWLIGGFRRLFIQQHDDGGSWAFPKIENARFVPLKYAFCQEVRETNTPHLGTPIVYGHNNNASH